MDPYRDVDEEHPSRWLKWKTDPLLRILVGPPLAIAALLCLLALCFAPAFWMDAHHWRRALTYYPALLLTLMATAFWASRIHRAVTKRRALHPRHRRPS
jgi:hypothetical protein